MWAWQPTDGSLREAAPPTRCASIWAYSNATRAAIVAATCHTTDPAQPHNQAFDLLPAGQGAVRLRARLSGLCLSAGTSAAGDAITQEDCNGAQALLWAPIQDAPGSGVWTPAAGGSLCVAAQS